jgi:hypothetical protein
MSTAGCKSVLHFQSLELKFRIKVLILKYEYWFLYKPNRQDWNVKIKFMHCHFYQPTNLTYSEAVCQRRPPTFVSTWKLKNYVFPYVREHRPLSIYYHWSIIITNKHNRTDLMYWYSALLHVSAVYISHLHFCWTRCSLILAEMSAHVTLNYAWASVHTITLERHNFKFV